MPPPLAHLQHLIGEREASDQGSRRAVEQEHVMPANQAADPIDVDMVLQAQREDEVCQ